MKIEGECFDLIGDVHGHLELLLQMIARLGYYKKGSSFFHPKGRKIVLVGDLINRGPDSTGVLKLVKLLHQSGIAHVCMGNHEFRLLQQAQQNPSKVPAKFLPYLDWLRIIPFFLEGETCRVVHAAWHYSSIEILRGKIAGDDVFLAKTLQKSSPEQQAVDLVLGGIKVSLPETPILYDRFNIPRKKARIKWWLNLEKRSYADSLYSPMQPEIHNQFPNPEEIGIIETYLKEDPIVFLGHYCLPPIIPKIMEQVVCLDGCVTCDQVLWAYRHNGEPEPEERNLVSCPASKKLYFS